MESHCVSTPSPHAGSAGAPAVARVPPAEAVKSGEKFVTEQTIAPEAAPGTVPVLMAEVRYGIVFAEMNEVFYSRIHKFLMFLTILCGILSATGFVTLGAKLTSSQTMLVMSFGLAVVSAFAEAARRAYKLDSRAKEFANAKKTFQTLEGKGWAMTQRDLQKELAKLRGSAPAGGGWLANIAYNRACEELGHPEYHIDVSAPIRVLGAALAH